MAQLYIKETIGWVPLTPAHLGGGGGGGGGDASAANQVIGNTRLGDVAETAPDADTAASGINGRLQRIAQRITSLIALLPVSLGAKAAAASLSVVPATDAVHTMGGITVVANASFSRPADTTAYASGDLVANSTAAGSVAPLQLTAVRVAGGSGIVRRLRLHKSGTSLTSASFRVHLFSAAPTVANGDNGAFSSSGAANYIGRADITLDQAFTDGAWGASDSSFTDLQVKLASGQIVYALLEAKAAYTPVSGETFTLRAEILQD